MTSGWQPPVTAHTLKPPWVVWLAIHTTVAHGAPEILGDKQTGLFLPLNLLTNYLLGTGKSESKAVSTALQVRAGG